MRPVRACLLVIIANETERQSIVITVIIPYRVRYRMRGCYLQVRAAEVGEVPDDTGSGDGADDDDTIIISSAAVGRSSGSSASSASSSAAAAASAKAARRPHRLHMPISMLYGGSHDWMPAEAGFQTAAGESQWTMGEGLDIDTAAGDVGATADVHPA